MFQLLTPLKEKPKKVAKLVYQTPELSADYRGALTHKEFSTIANLFFKLALHAVVEGHSLDTPVGIVRSQRIYMRKRMIDFIKLKNPELHDNLWRENDYVDMVVWDANLSKRFVKGYIFKATESKTKKMFFSQDLRQINLYLKKHNL